MDRLTIVNSLILTVLVLVFVPNFFHENMFLDGVTYAAISHNLANGLGTYFAPHYTQTLYPSFYEHPPLSFILQSFLFQLLGSGIYIEKVYGLIMFLSTAYGIILIYDLINQNKKDKINPWIVILLWLIIPVVSWSYKNNVIENTLTLWTTFGVYFLLKYLVTKSTKFLLLSSVLIALAFYTKGLVAFFPLMTPLAWFYIYEKSDHKKVFIKIFLLFSFVGIGIAIPYLFLTGLHENINCYFHEQVYASIINRKDATSANQLLIIFLIAKELFILLLLSIVLFFTIGKHKFTINKEALFFLIIALSASLPLLISPKQRDFYLLPATVFYALFFFQILSPYILQIKYSKKLQLPIKFCLLLMIIICFFLEKSGALNHKNDIKNDARVIARTMPYGSLLYADWKYCSNWELHAILARTNYVSLRCEKPRDFVLLSKDENMRLDWKPHYTEMQINLKEYKLFRRMKSINP